MSLNLQSLGVRSTLLSVSVTRKVRYDDESIKHNDDPAEWQGGDPDIDDFLLALNGCDCQYCNGGLENCNCQYCNDARFYDDSSEQKGNNP